MKHGEFSLGGEFVTPTGRWRCTDVGTRVIVAISLEGAPQNCAGPPYSVPEIVFDEYDLDGCEPAPAGP